MMLKTLKTRGRLFIGMFLLVGILVSMLSIGVVSAYLRSTPQFTAYQGPDLFGADISSLEFDDEMCQQGQDFVIQIAPFGCQPAVVRDDLLEEQNVPVFCQLAATKINPLIDVDAINSMQITGDFPDDVAGIGYQPARAALGTQERLTSPILDNIGYAVIVLKKQPNNSAMPDYVDGNLTAKIKYDVKNAFGVGQATYYLNEVSDDNWENERVKYSFWNGKGYLRAEDIENTEATISVYDDSSRLQSFTLQKGETSGKVNLPGFACYANLQLKLQSLENPDTRARLRVNEEYVEAGVGESFLDNKCTVQEVSNIGLRQSVKLKCKEDNLDNYGTTVNSFILSIAPQVKLDIGGRQLEASVGDFLFDDPTTTAGRIATSYYLGHTATIKNSGKEDDLEVVIVGMPTKNKVDRLSDKDLKLVETIVKGIRREGTTEIEEKVTAIKLLQGLGEFFIGTTNYLYSHMVKHQSIEFIEINKLETVGNQQITLNGFAGIVDGSFESKEIEEYYSKALGDYQTLIETYSTIEITGEGITYGEKAYESIIRMQKSLEQMNSVLLTCDKFKQKYPESKLYKQLVEEGLCVRSAALSNSETSTGLVFVNGKSRKISLIHVDNPDFNDFGAVISMRHPDGKLDTFNLGKNEIWGDEEGPYIQLVDLTDNAAKVKVSLKRDWKTKESVKEAIKEFFVDTKTINLGQSENFESSYTFTVNKINLDKSAKVSVIPNINNVGSETNFSFRVGIEKRSIQLSPDKTKSIIKSLNRTIEDWEETSDKLGELTTGLRKACLGVGAVLVVKNFFSNIGGKGIARQEVMRGPGGWNEKCAAAVDSGKLDGATVNYVSVNDCLTENAAKIEDGVNAYAKAIEDQEKKIETIQKPFITKDGVFGEQVVDTGKFGTAYLSSSYKSDLKTNLKRKFGDNMEIDGKQVSVDSFVDSLDTDTLTIEEMKSLELNAGLSTDGALGDISKNRLQSQISTIYTSATEKRALEDVKTNSESSPLGNVPWTLGQHETLRYEAYNGYEAKSDLGTGIKAGMNLQGYRYKGQNYYLELSNPNKDKEGTYFGVANVYDTTGKKIDLTQDTIASEVQRNVAFRQYDSSSYNNKYINPKLQYYGSGAYEGLPSIVPFDTKAGWYAATKQTIATGSNIQSYDKSGRVSSFYVCNVGENNLQEFYSTSGDDICQMVNTGTGQPYNQFPGLSETESKEIIKKAGNAIEEASRKYKSGITGQVDIAGTVLDIGAPAADIPDMQCQDFMSPRDCQIMFNVCDPVICPSSRCDLGGNYPVKDVIQTGVIGGLILCLPNFKEGIYLPICLSGIHAGLEAWTGVLKEYRDCMQENLETGEMVGICDEIYSVHLCEFFWRQAAPLAEVGIPKLVGAIFGKTAARGGGEYLSVQNAWDKGKQSFDYFTSYYAASSFSAFKARTTEEIGSIFCNSFISGVGPNTGSILDQLTKPESPAQFHGRFDAIPFSTTTNPPTTHYKVFYYIYAGQGSRAYYKVYLKGESGGSFYQDVGGTRLVAQGYIAEGGTESETIDFTAPTGYTQLCINVNGQEVCDFKTVSTDFALNYAADKYKQQQIDERGITNEADCVSGTASGYSLLTPSAGGALEELANPAIYNRGIIRICATDNPGRGSDEFINTERQRWVDVGYCGNQNMRCWLDKSTVDDIIKTQSVEDETVESLTNQTTKLLEESGYFITDFESEYERIYYITDSTEKITEIGVAINRVFLYYQKAQLIKLRADIYYELALGLYDKNQEGRTIAKTQDEEDEQQAAAIGTGRCTACGEGALNACDEAECNSISRGLESGGMTGCVFLPKSVARGDLVSVCLSKSVWINTTGNLDRVKPLLDLGADVLVDVGDIDFDKYRAMKLGEINNFEGQLRIVGKVTGGEVGRGLSKGTIVVDGIDFGNARVGFEMTGGQIIIHGPVTGDVGPFMKGGEIEVTGDVEGNVGNRISNGQIIITGKVEGTRFSGGTGGTIILQGVENLLYSTTYPDGLELGDTYTIDQIIPDEARIALGGDLEDTKIGYTLNLLDLIPKVYALNYVEDAGDTPVAKMPVYVDTSSSYIWVCVNPTNYQFQRYKLTPTGDSSYPLSARKENKKVYATNEVYAPTLAMSNSLIALCEEAYPGAQASQDKYYEEIGLLQTVSVSHGQTVESIINAIEAKGVGIAVKDAGCVITSATGDAEHLIDTRIQETPEGTIKSFLDGCFDWTYYYVSDCNDLKTYVTINGVRDVCVYQEA